MNKILSQIRGVCFDAGNVLCWFEYPRFADVLATFGFDVPKERFRPAELFGRDCINEALRSLAENHQPDNTSHVRLYLGGILEKLDVPADMRDRIVQALLDESQRETLWCELQPGTPEVLAELTARGYVLGVFSNTGKGDCEEVLGRCGISSFFPTIVDSFLVGLEKPDPRAFKLAVLRMGLLPSQVLYVGDLYMVDIVGSRNAGLVPVLLDPLGRTEGRDCLVITSLAGLLDLLPGKGR